MSEVLRLYHGSPIRVKRPLFGVGNPYNDYGLGFYCTESFELACEWACPKAKDGFANAYDLELAGLRVVDLDAEPYGTIEWLAVLFANRQFDVPTSLMESAKSYVAARYPSELGEADVVVGYRDSMIMGNGFWQRPGLTLYFWAATLLLLLGGLKVFKRLRPHFSDVL